MDRQRLMSAAVAAATLGILLVPAAVRATDGTNLNIIPGPGLKLGVAKVTGKTVIVRLVRTKPQIQPPLNDGNLRIADIPAGADVTPPVGGQTFAEAFPNGAFELADVGWGDFRIRQLFAGKHCLQVGSASGEGYDAARVYCDKTGVTRIKVSSGTGNDVVVVDPAITIAVTNVCGGRRTRCGTLTCLESTPYTCCDAFAGLEGCIDLSGGTCEVDPDHPMVWCPSF